MIKYFLYTITIFFSNVILCQKICNTIEVESKLDAEKNIIDVNEEITLYNPTDHSLDRLYLTIWINGHKSKHSKLTKAQLERRRTKLYFQKNKKRGGIYDLEISEKYHFFDYDIIEILPKTPLKSKDSIKISLNFLVKIPDYNITKNGNDGDYYHLKNWFVTIPEFENDKQIIYSNKNFDDEFNSPTNYNIHLKYPLYLKAISNLTIKDNYTFFGKNINNVEILLNNKIKHNFHHTSFERKDGTKINIESESKLNNTLISKQLMFLENRLGNFPASKILLSKRNKNKNKFIGLNDIKGFGFNIELFSKEIQKELNLFKQITNQFVNNKLFINKRKDHWILNGTKTYMQIKYLEQFYPDLKLIGQADDNFRFLGAKPLKTFHISKLNLRERYTLMNLFVIRKNVDQKITTPLDSLRNLNHSIISSIHTGLGFNYLNSYTDNDFDKGIKDFFSNNNFKLVGRTDFEQTLKQHSSKNINWFFREYLETKKPYDYQLKKIKKSDDDSIKLIIKNKYNSKGPFRLTAYNKDSILLKKWIESKNGRKTYSILNKYYTRLEINDHHIVPEINNLNNHINTTGLFKNKKIPQLKFLTDIQNPEYAQIFFQPIFDWNNYDGLLLGTRLYNSTLINKRFLFTISPRYSVETRSLTGSTSVKYSIYPKKENNIFERIQLNSRIAYYHYDRNLSYFKFSPSISFKFKRKYERAEINNSLSFRLNLLDKQTPMNTKIDEDKYQYAIFSPIFRHSNNYKINEFSYFISIHQNKNFGKLFGSAYFRKRYTPKKVIGARIFAGYFYHNNTESNYFNFGLDRVNDYMFDYQLHGRSETSGLLSQEYVLAEGGFKSNFKGNANKWMITTNIETDVWWRLSLYGDFGYLKNKYESSKFMYDSGIRLKFIPDFLEFYFPIQSTLGFEPSLNDKNYLERIRFVFKPNFRKAISYLRRGWY